MSGGEEKEQKVAVKAVTTVKVVNDLMRNEKYVSLSWRMTDQGQEKRYEKKSFDKVSPWSRTRYYRKRNGIIRMLCPGEAKTCDEGREIPGVPGAGAAW